MKKVIITESQLQNFVRTLVNEETKNNILTVNFGTIWPMGKWKLNEKQTVSINNKIGEINKFIQQNNNSRITIQVESGESQVTNKDMEVNPPVSLETGVLAKRRGEVVTNYLKEYFKKQVGTLITEKQFPIIHEPKIVIGTTPYTKGSNDLKDPDKVKLYQQEQHVRAVISLEQKYECMVGLNVTVGYFSGKNKSKHNCDEAIFLLKMNGVNIGIVNLNNSKIDVEYTNWVKSKSQEIPMIFKIKAKRKGITPEEYTQRLKVTNNKLSKLNRKSDGIEGGTRSQVFNIDENMAKNIVNETNRIVLTLTPLIDQNGEYSVFHENGNHTESPWVIIKNSKTNEVYYNGEPNIGFQRGSMSETKLLTLDNCGKPIKKET